MSIRSSFLRRIRAYSNPGQDLRPDQLLDHLTRGLSDALGPFPHQTFRTQPTKMTVRVYAGKPGKQKAVEKVLSDLDFSVTRNASSGYIGGGRVEINGKSTVVNYNGLSGVLIINTTLVKQSDIIDI